MRGRSFKESLSACCALFAFALFFGGCKGCRVDPTHQDEPVACETTAECVDRFGEEYECVGDPGMCVRASRRCEDDSDCEDGVCVDEVCVACRNEDTRPCGTNVGECEFGTQTCVDHEWGECEGGIGPTVEVCDGRDNDCNGIVDDVDPLSAPLADMQEGVCEGTRKVCEGGGWVEPDYTLIPDYEEVEVTCDGLDNDCSGTVDDFDPSLAPLADKQDGVCEGAVQVCAGAAGWVEPDYTLIPDYEEVEASCDGLDNDCSGTVDDIDPSFAPLADMQEGVCEGARKVCEGAVWVEPDYTTIPGYAPVEICTDGLDNTCDGLVDLEDEVACPPIDVSIIAWADPIGVSHGRTHDATASISPDDATPPEWPREWAVVGAVGDDCDPPDVALSDQIDQPGSTGITATMPDVLEKVGCLYTLEVTVNGYARDWARLRMVNRLPRVTIDDALQDGDVWYMHALPGGTPEITARTTDLDGDSIHLDWSGPDAGLLSCAPDCESFGDSPHVATVTFADPASPDIYELVVEARDGFDPTPGTATVILEVDECLWVSATGAGDGSAPDNALASIQAALEQARLAPSTAVCIAGEGTFVEDLVLPSTPNAPNLLGGFDADGTPSNARPIVEVSTEVGVTFEAGYDGMLRRLRLRQHESLADDAPAAVVTVQAASPRLLHVWVNTGRGSPSVGVHVHGGAADTAPTAPAIVRSSVSGPVSPNPTGVLVMVEPGGDVSPRVAGGNISMNGDGISRGIHVLDGARIHVGDAASVSASSPTGDAVGIDLEGTAARPVTARIEGASMISANSEADVSVAIRLRHTDSVIIRGNQQVGSAWSQAGRRLGAGIADGHVRRDGTVVEGGSTGLVIEDNRAISGGASWWAGACDAGGLGEGADVTAGILLVGTSDVLIQGNGKGGANAGVFGGSSTVHWDASARRLPPSSVGLWLVGTEDVTVVNNELRSGVYETKAACAAPLEIPAGVAYRDGLPPNIHMGAPGELPSSGTLLDRNGASCAQPLQGVAPTAGLSWCVVAELNAPDPALGAPRLTNNYLAATKGEYLVALRQRGGAGVTAANNTFDSDLMLRPGETPPLTDSIRKWPVLLEHIEPGGIELVNNIVYAHSDDPYDIPSERLCLHEVVPAGTESRIGRLRNNLFHVQDEGSMLPVLPVLVRVTDGVSTAAYDADELNAIAGITDIEDNFEAPPGLTEPSDEWQKSTARLLPGSAAIDAGLPVGGIVPAHDIDGEARPGPSGDVDVGHDEVHP